MRAVIQRVSEAKVEIDGKVHGEIGIGFVVLLGVEDADTSEDVDWLLRKILALRIFSDEEGKMNADINDVEGKLLVISQFTLHAKTKKGNRPSFIRAASPAHADKLYEEFLAKAEKEIPQRTQRGEFGANMQVSLCNDGPVTIIIDTKNKE